MSLLAQNPELITWQQFKETAFANGCNLLKRLDEFPNSILVTGCQRSGTTMLSRIITQSDGMINYYFGPDDELDAALILSGYINHQPQGRYCFQTTYLDQCYGEYYKHNNGHKIVWVLRNPYSTIYSLLYNWPPRALKNTFRSFVASSFTGADKWGYKLLDTKHFSRVQQACMVFNKKISQLLELRQTLGAENILVVDYDELVVNKRVLLPEIYNFINLSYKPEYADKIHTKSLKKSNQLSESENETIKSSCESYYIKAQKFRLHPKNLSPP